MRNASRTLTRKLFQTILAADDTCQVIHFEIWKKDAFKVTQDVATQHVTQTSEDEHESKGGGSLSPNYFLIPLIYLFGVFKELSTFTFLLFGYILT